MYKRQLLDVETLRSSKDQDKDIGAALDALQKDSGYLFESAETPPPYAAEMCIRDSIGLVAEPEKSPTQ